MGTLSDFVARRRSRWARAALAALALALAACAQGSTPEGTVVIPLESGGGAPGPVTTFGGNLDGAYHRASPTVALTETGDAFVAWSVETGTEAWPFYSHYSASTGTWAPEAPFPWHKVLAVRADGAGFLVAYLNQVAPGLLSLETRRFAAGVWSPAQVVGTTSQAIYHASLEPGDGGSSLFWGGARTHDGTDDADGAAGRLLPGVYVAHTGPSGPAIVHRFPLYFHDLTTLRDTRYAVGRDGSLGELEITADEVWAYVALPGGAPVETLLSGKRWGTAQILAVPGGFLAIWSEQDPAVETRFMASAYRQGAWQPPVVLDRGGTAANVLVELQAAAGTDGALVAWTVVDGTDGTYTVRAAPYAAGAFGPAEALSGARQPGRIRKTLRIVASDAGYHVLWTEQPDVSGTAAVIAHNVMKQGVWQGRSVVAGGYTSLARIASLGGDRLGIAWPEVPDAYSAAVFDGDRWGTPVQLGRIYLAAESDLGGVAGIANGTLLLTWTDRQDPDQLFVRAGLYRNGAWGVPVNLAMGAHPSSHAAPMLVANARGDVVARWSQYYRWTQWVATRHNGAWGAPMVVSDPPTGRSEVVTDGAEFMLVYDAVSGTVPTPTGEERVYDLFVRFTTDGTWGDPVRLAGGFGPNGSGFQAIATPGTFLVNWTGPESPGCAVRQRGPGGWLGATAACPAGPVTERYTVSGPEGFLRQAGSGAGFCLFDGTAAESCTVLDADRATSRAVASDGHDYLAVWSKARDATGQPVWYSRRVGGVWEAPRTLPGADGGVERLVASGSTGYLLLVRDFTGEVVAWVHDGTSWDPGTPVLPTGATGVRTLLPPQAPDVVAGPDGYLVFGRHLAADGSGSVKLVKRVRIHAGGAWGPQYALPDSTSFQYSIRSGAATDGGYALLMVRTPLDGSARSLLALVYLEGVGWQAPVVVTGAFEGDPSDIVGSGGGYVAGWSQNEAGPPPLVSQVRVAEF